MSPLRSPAPAVASSLHLLGNRAVGRLLQSKFTISEAGSPSERAADHAAERVLRMPLPSTGESPGKSSQTPQADSVARGDGTQPLPPQMRAFFEPRFGHDFSQVRIHTGESAALSARAFHARAYTTGRDIVFGAGQYSPGTASGQHLLAHELAHVVQQANAAESHAIQRMEFGSGTPPVMDGSTVLVVPEDERPLLSEAMARIREVADDPKRFSRCHEFFADECNGGPDTLKKTFDAARLWKWPPGVEHLGGAVANTPGANIAYMQYSYNKGVDWLAGALTHELLHNCGAGDDDTSPHRRADVARVYCMGPGKNDLSARIAVDRDHNVSLLFSYRRLLKEVAGGRLTLNAGVDLDVTNLLKLGDPTFRAPSELGSGIIGGRARLGGWGAERYGGILLTADLGFGVDRFKVRSPNASDPPALTTAPGVILQLGTRIEFWVPSIEMKHGRVSSLSFEADYRVVQPLTPDARQIHEVVFGLGGTL